MENLKLVRDDLDVQVASKKIRIKGLEKALKNKKEECATKDIQIQHLEAEAKIARSVQEHFCSKLFDQVGNEESLRSLLKLNGKELFSRYEQIMMDKNSDSKETLIDIKNRLNIQNIKRKHYENGHNEIMDVLDIAQENRLFENILPGIKSLKESNSNMRMLLLEQEQIEENTYSNAHAVLESSSVGEKNC